MQIYYPSLHAIEQQTMQLEHAQCAHCKQTQQLVSHGFIRKKQRGGADLAAVGKRVFCSNRNSRKGCGRTMQLYLDSTVRYLHHAGSRVVALVLSLIAGMTIEQAYHQAIGATAGPRNAYHWLNRLCAQLSAYRSLSHRPPLQDAPAMVTAHCRARLPSLMSTFTALLQRFGQPLCAAYQAQLQRPFL
jgi:hypothetical protein